MMVRILFGVCVAAVLHTSAAHADCLASYNALRATLEKAGIGKAQFMSACREPATARPDAAADPDIYTGGAAGAMFHGRKPPGGAITTPYSPPDAG